MRPSKDEVNFFVGNGEEVAVESIEDVSLELESRFFLELNDTVYVPSTRRNLSSGTGLDKLGYAFLL